MKGYLSDQGPRNTTKITPAIDLTPDLLGVGWGTEWLPLSGEEDRDRTGCDGGLHREHGTRAQ